MEPIPENPLVSIGLPVYNGENYVAEALKSIVEQTYHNLEIVVADNASTDSTEEICRDFAAGDERIRYTRHSENRGASYNHDFVFFQSHGPLFKQAAHDDMIAPTFVERCVDVFLTHPEVVVVFPRTRHIDAHGLEHEAIDDNLRSMASSNPAVRFGHIICRPNWATPVFATVRRDVVRSTILGRYVGADRTYLAELALAGPWYRVDEYLLYRRQHDATSTNTFTSELGRIAWFDPTAQQVKFPNWRRLSEFAKAIERAELGFVDHMMAYGQLGRWAITPWYRPRLVRLLRDPVLAGVGALRRSGGTDTTLPSHGPQNDGGGQSDETSVARHPPDSGGRPPTSDGSG